MYSMTNDDIVNLLQCLKDMSLRISQLRRSAAIDAQQGKPSEGSAAMASAAYELDKMWHNIVDHLPPNIASIARMNMAIP